MRYTLCLVWGGLMAGLMSCIVPQAGTHTTAPVEQEQEKAVDTCATSAFTAILREDPRLDSNTFTLMIYPADQQPMQVRRLDLRPGMSRISYCTSDYIVAGFPCGGPCYSRVFIFVDSLRPVEVYGYSQPITGTPDLITYIQDEKFETLTIRNLKQGKEIQVDIRDCMALKTGPCYMDSIYLRDNKLVLMYDTGSDHPNPKSIDVRALLQQSRWKG
jgi:hypothetical protein